MDTVSWKSTPNWIERRLKSTKASRPSQKSMFLTNKAWNNFWPKTRKNWSNLRHYAKTSSQILSWFSTHSLSMDLSIKSRKKYRLNSVLRRLLIAIHTINTSRISWKKKLKKISRKPYKKMRSKLVAIVTKILISGQYTTIGTTFQNTVRIWARWDS